MSEPIKWAETSDKERVRLIIEYVFHFSILPDCMDVYGYLAIPEEIDGKRLTYPLAFYDSINERWMLTDDRQETISFNPLRSMDDAMQIAEEINAGNFTLERVVTPPVAQQVNYARYSDKPVFYEAAFYLGENWTKTTQTYHNQANTPHEAICIAALRSRGIEVINEK